MDEKQAQELLSFADDAASKLKGLEAREWRDRLERRYQNLEVAFAWFLSHNRINDAARMAIALYDFWTLAGRITDGRSWFDQALAVGSIDKGIQAQALYHDGLLAFWQGKDEAARSLHQHSLDLAQQMRDATATALALVGLARVALRAGDLDEARALCEQALMAVQGTGDKLGRSNALHVLAVAAQMRGDLLEARERMTERLQLARELESFRGVAVEAGNLSHVERRLGNLARAEELALEALQISERRGDEWAIPFQFSALAAVAVETRNFVRAAKLLGAAIEMTEQQGAAWPPDEAPLFEQSREAAAQGLEPSAFEQAWSAGRSMPFAEAVSYAQQRVLPGFIPSPR